MSLDRAALAQAVAAHGRVVRVVVAGSKGSAPREAGAAMLVWPDGQAGTIGGGALEWHAAAEARAQLESGREVRLRRMPLGPGLGQCCGGAVTLVTEVIDAGALSGIPRDGLRLRPVTGDATLHGVGDFLRPGAGDTARPGAGAQTPPVAVQKLVAQARAGHAVATQLVAGWLVEPVAAPGQSLWLYGAGHVGRAIVATLSPLPDWAITWVDTAAERFPTEIPAGVTPRIAEDPATLVAEAPAGAHHLILTYSHALDLALCHAVLSRGFASAGLIGSATKWARFRRRLIALGHAEPDRIACPIGDPGLGKHPQAIAVGVAAALIRTAAAPARTTARRA